MFKIEKGGLKELVGIYSNSLCSTHYLPNDSEMHEESRKEPGTGEDRALLANFMEGWGMQLLPSGPGVTACGNAMVPLTK